MKILNAIATVAAVSLSWVSHAQSLVSRTGPYEVQVLVGGSPTRSFHFRHESYVLGQLGERYTLRVWNRSGQRVEAVVSVDGRDVIAGKPGDFATQRGYLVLPHSHVDIDGWRLSQREAAAFRFSTVADSYAAKKGSARNVGVIGVAVFPERYLPPPPIVHHHRGHDRDYPSEEQRSFGPNSSAPRREPADDLAQAPGDGRQQRSAEAMPQSESKHDRAPSSRRAGLGTEFGERVESQIHEVEFVRADSSHPAALLGLRYNDRQGLLAIGIDVDGPRPWREAELRRSASPFPYAQGYASPPPGWRD